MRKLGIVEFVTLDGVMQGFGGPDEDREGGFVYGGWGAPYFDESIARSASLSQSTVYLLGRKTYQAMAGHWPHEPAENMMAAHLNRADKYVATHTLKSLEWSNAHVLEGELAPAVQRLKASGEGHIVVLGSGALVESLSRAGLVDQYRLFVHPLLLGTGKRLFRDLPRPRPLRLVDCTPTSTGVLMLSYEVA
jgi:dihydrofolate reductase